jgi:DedD protein
MADLQETIDLRRRARRRLIGAIALVLALVIVPPWIMDLEPKPAATRLSVEIPSQDAGRLKPPVKPAPEAPRGAESAAKPAESAKPTEPPKPPEASKPAPTAKSAAPGPQSLDARTVAALGAPKTEPAPAEPPRAADDKAAVPAKGPEAAARPADSPSKQAETAKKPAQTASAAPAPGAEAFVVPLGSYSNAENVKQLQARLALEGIQTYTEPVKTAAGDRTRVRAGPYASREAAEKARERVKGMGIDAGNVITRQ